MSDTILIADDDNNVLIALRMLLDSYHFDVVTATTPEAVIEKIKTMQLSAVLMDMNYQRDTTSGKEGLALIERIGEIDDTLPIIVMTGYGSVKVAVEAMKLGASDFVEKPWVNERLIHIIHTQLQLHHVSQEGNKLAQENALLKDQIHPIANDIVAESAVMKQVLSQLEKLAVSDMSILLTGENGTGKSLLADYIHRCSSRSSYPFIAVNMGAISEPLFESEMFGHAKGAFTDAKKDRIGRFALAETGTIFLDEIANISTVQQAKLLRVLEEKKFEKVGCNKTHQVNVRLLSATNANIDQMLVDQTFRQDLLFRLNTVTIHVPSLKERHEDIVPLAMRFMTKFAKKYGMTKGHLSPAAIDALLSYEWPGNIRELGHVIERALFLRNQDVIEPHDLALTPLSPVKPENVTQWQAMTLDEVEKSVIEERFLKLNKNPLQVAKSLGLSRSAYYRRLEKYQLI